METREAWHQAEVECTTSLAQLYINSEGGDVIGAATNLVIDSWTKAMKQLNASVQQQKFGDKVFDDLTIEEKLKLEFSAPHPTLGWFAQTVRFAAAGAQKVA